MPAFDSVYARLTAAYPALRVHGGRPRTGDGWAGSAELAAGGPALDALIAAEAAQGLREHGVPLRPEVAASFCLHRYAWRVCLLMSLPWFLERRVPRLPVERVSVNGRAGRVSADIRAFACLPGDPAASLPEAWTVADEEALRGALRAAVAEHLEPVLAAFRPRLRRGPHGLWAMATDALVEGLWHVGGRLGQERRAVAELGALLPGGVRPFRGGAQFCPAAGTGCPTRTRSSCCLYYTLGPGRICATCPRGGADDRWEPLAAS
jgi:FhuF 2Fe-2S C-terminal domain